MYKYEDVENFEELFSSFEELFSNKREKVHIQNWLDNIYMPSEKWVECFMRNVHTLGMWGTQLSKNLNRHKGLFKI